MGRKKILYLAMLFLVAGCTAISQRHQPFHNIVSNRVFLPKDARSTAQLLLVATRERGFYGGGCSSFLYVDGQMVAAIEQGERLTLPLATAGDHQLMLKSSGACKAWRQHTMKVTTKTGHNIYFRINARGDSIKQVS